MKIELVDRAFAAFLFLLGLYIALSAPSYGYIDGGNPGPGFFPFWIGALLAGLSVANFVRSLAGQEKLAETLALRELAKPLGIVALLAVFVLVSEPLGMLLSTAALVPALAALIRPRWDRRFAVKVLATAVLFPLLACLTFGVYLDVPLPRGLLGF
ncbi:tripartite tricarboxylate transporter TctB family protein [Orrella sp. JC864]|uniref:tripartite tricarboxylate transporter TctB family protein n=1 Tax=Orrella sp. JC864 TaxID=3120298 RepID=UPI00300A6EFC